LIDQAREIDPNWHKRTLLKCSAAIEYVSCIDHGMLSSKLIPFELDKITRQGTDQNRCQTLQLDDRLDPLKLLV